METGALPTLAFVRDAALVEICRDLLQPDTAQRLLEDLPDDRAGVWIDFEGRPLLGPILDLDPSVAERGLGAQKEPTRSGFTHATRDLLSQVLRVELVDALDDRLHQLPRRRVVGVLGDRGDSDATPAQHRLEGHRMFSLAGEAGELPDQDFLEGRVGLARLIKHHAELGPVCDPPAFSLVDVLAHDDVPVSFRVVPERPELGGYREIYILAVAGDASIESSRPRMCRFVHR